MSFGLKVDGREPAEIFKALTSDNIMHTRTDLDVGDFEISSSERVGVIIERKTWQDLVGSLTSEHLSEQMARLTDKCRDTGARPVLLVEHEHVVGWGEFNSWSATQTKFISCTLAKYALEGFSVIHTKDVAHTKDTVAWILKRCQEDKVPTFTPEFKFSGVAGSKRYRKKDYDKPWEVMLTAVRGVSKARAKAIVSRFPSARALASALEIGADIGVKGISPGNKISNDIKQALIGKI